MATLKDALQYASQNPTSDFAKQLSVRIKSGQADQEAKSLGIDLTPVKMSEDDFTQSIKKPSFKSDLKGDIKETGSDLFTTGKKTFGKIKEAVTPFFQGKQGLKETAYQAGGELAMGATNAFGDLIKGGVKGGLSESAEQSIQGGVQSVGTAVAPTAQSAMENPFVKNLMSRYETLSPEAKRNVDATLGFASLATEFVGGGLVKKPLKEAVETVVDVAKGAGRKTVDMVGNIQPTTVGGAVSDIITPIERTVETTLNPTSIIPKDKLSSIPIENIRAVSEAKDIKFKNYLKQAEKAVVDNSQKTPLAVAGDKATEAANVIQNKINKQNQLKKEALGVVGDKKVSNIQEVRDFFGKELEDKVGVKLADFNETAINLFEGKKNAGLTNAPGRKSKVSFDAADNKLISDTDAVLRDLGDSPTVREIDDTVDALQDLLYKRKGLTAIPVNGQVESVIKNITGKLNRAVKKVAGEQYTKANSKMAYMIDTFDTLNKALGKEGERGASLMKSLFSPSGEKPRRLFAEIKKLTGIDLTEEATIAKFVMENVGDARQASLLEEVIRGRTMSPTGLIEKAFDRAIGKLQDPIGKAQRIIKDIPKGQSTPIKPSSQIKKPFVNTQGGKVAIGSNFDDIIIKDLMSYDTLPVTSNRGIEFGNTKVNFRLSELQKIAEKRMLKPAEIKEAEILLDRAGGLSDLAKKRGATAINPLTAGAAVGLGAAAIANKKK